MPTIITTDPAQGTYSGLPSKFATYADFPRQVASYADIPYFSAVKNAAESASVSVSVQLGSADVNGITTESAFVTVKVSDAGSVSEDQSVFYGGFEGFDQGYGFDTENVSPKTGITDSGVWDDVGLLHAYTKDSDPLGYSTYAAMPSRFATYAAIPLTVDMYGRLPWVTPTTFVIEYAWVVITANRVNPTDQNGPVTESATITHVVITAVDAGGSIDESGLLHVGYTDTDAGTATETQTTGYPVMVADQGAGSEVVSNLARVDEDTGGSTEIPLVQASLTSGDDFYSSRDDRTYLQAQILTGDSGYASESAQEAISAIPGLDSGSGSDLGLVAAQIAYEDFAGRAVEQAQVGAISQTVVDSGISTDFATVTVVWSVSDQATSSETAWQTFTPAREYGTSTEFQSLQVVLSTADMGSAFEIGRKLIKEAVPGRAHYLIAVDGVDVTRLLSVVGDHG